MRCAGRSPRADMVWPRHDLGSCWWDVDHAGWVVTLSSPDEQEFYGRTLEEALTLCLVWLMAPELGIGPFLVRSSALKRPGRAADVQSHDNRK
jgi:hypothetical protein